MPIPDDPPPHEGALIDLPYIIEPPDIIAIEVIEALPGRPIQGERLVRPDGKISLGYYGEIEVRGLTLEQVKVKVIRRMQDFVTDEVLGLVQVRIMAEGQPEEAPKLPEPGRQPFRLQPDGSGPVQPPAPPDSRDPAPVSPPTSRPDPKPASLVDRGRRRALTARPRGADRRGARPRRVSQVPDPGPADQGKPGQDPAATVEIMVNEADLVREVVAPADSNRVFVDIASYNSKVYFVQGDVGQPGRLPWTGAETVLDALQYAGGLTATAEPKDIHLYRPARAGKPTKDYPIDLDAIRKGNPVANLQLFPGDRLVVGRNAIVQKTAEIDRAAAPINSIFNNLLQHSFATRSLAAGIGDLGVTTQAQRDEAIRGWSDFLWGLSSKEGGAMMDDKAFREAVMKRLGTPPPPK